MANAFQAIMDNAAKPAAEKAPRAPRPAKPIENAKPGKTTAPEQALTTPPAKAYRPVREGKRFVGAHFPPEVAKQIKMLAAEDETTVQLLLEQAVDLLFAKHGKARAAELLKK